jgi:hypothetical protein
VERGEARRVWLDTSSRGDRKAADWLAFLDLCRERDCRIYVGQDERDYRPQKRQEWKTLKEQGIANEDWTEIIAEGVERTKRMARRDRNMRTALGGRPRIGYQAPPGVGPDDEGWDWIVEPVVGAALTAIVEAMDRGANFRAAFGPWAGRLHQAAYRKAPARTLTERNVRYAIHHPATYGLLWNRDRTALEPTGKPSPVEPKWWPIMEAIFAADPRHDRPDWRNSQHYPYGPILRCSRCGNQLTGELVYQRARRRTVSGRAAISKEVPTYRCHNPHPELAYSQDVMIAGKLHRKGEPITKACRGVGIRASEVDAYLGRRVGLWRKHSKTYAAALAAQEGLGDDIAAAEARLAVQQGRFSTLRDELNADEIDDQEYARHAAALRERIGEIRGEIDRLGQRQARALPAAIEWDRLSDGKKLDLIDQAFATPILVQPGRRANPQPSVDERMPLVPKLARARKEVGTPQI